MSDINNPEVRNGCRPLGHDKYSVMSDINGVFSIAPMMERAD